MFQIGDWVWIYLRKERFPKQRKNKQLPRADEPFQITEKYGDNAYRVDLPEHYRVSPIFNIGDLRPYYDASKLGTIRSEEGGNAPRPPLCELNTENMLDKNNNNKDTEIDQQAKHGCSQ